MNPNLLIHIIGVVAILAGILQLFVFHHQWQKLKVTMNEHTTGWMPLSLWTSVWFGIVFIVVGIGFLFFGV
ncbi:hypothetical protein [Pediococcus cellicola]|uniref:Immunity protein PlnM n=1 Tax=Pediococcus cellicola TaxID=319652 RepID=A0A0R2IV87_9LACO|nr:hypothetical protein [Pediococcus cellicola]KRN65863.1 hypothetical protein IV80_GL001702 [Pediococcus cellicola]GEL15677.1 hypothetical protein PCE01_14790 [Pediococcus cellicola]